MLIASATCAACASSPNARELIQSPALYQEAPKFVGSEGQVSAQQGISIVRGLEKEQDKQSEILRRHLAFEQSISGIPLTLGNKVTLLENASATYQAMLEAIRGAKDSINLEMYIFSDGPIGDSFADALTAAQLRGVQVNLMYDSVGSMRTSGGFFERMRDTGINILEYHPVNPFRARLAWSISHRDHRKQLVVDGGIAFTGGINISEEYASGLGSGGSSGGNEHRKKISHRNADSWRDTDVEVEGPAVAEFQRLFVEQWQSQNGPELSRRGYFPEIGAHGDQIVRVIGSVPQQASLIYITMVSAITNAEANVYLTDAYFAPDSQMINAMEAAARRGVDVELLLPAQTDEPFIDAAARSDYERLLEAGVKIHEWRGKMLHAKTATIDGVWSTVGSSNLDWWSIARNDEINAVILGYDFNKQVELMFKNDLEQSEQIELGQWRERSFVERAKELIAKLIKRWL